VQFETSGDSADAEIVVITHEVQEANFRSAVAAITALPRCEGRGRLPAHALSRR